MARLEDPQLLDRLPPLHLQAAVEERVDGGPQVVAEAGAHLLPLAVHHALSLRSFIVIGQSRLLKCLVIYYLRVLKWSKTRVSALNM